MGIKDRFKQISSNASSRTEDEEALKTRDNRHPRTAPGMAAAASRLFVEERDKLLQEINQLREQLENATANDTLSDSAKAEINALKKQLEEKESEYGIKQIKVSDCHIKPATKNTPSRKRQLSSKEFDALKQSIKTVGMSVPILVEPREGGGYWIVAGHNRHQVHLDEKIECIRAEVVNPDELNVDAAALVSNLLTPELSTYEFYQGIRYFKDQLGKTLTDIADMTGRGKSTISEYFSLEKLPESVLEFLKNSNLQIGSNAVAKLVKVTTPENIHLILDALLAVSKGANWNDQLAKVIKETQQTGTTKKTTRPQIIKIERSGKTVATMAVRQNNLSIKFAGPNVPEDLMKKIQNIIDESIS